MGARGDSSSASTVSKNLPDVVSQKNQKQQTSYAHPNDKMRGQFCGLDLLLVHDIRVLLTTRPCPTPTRPACSGSPIVRSNSSRPRRIAASASQPLALCRLAVSECFHFVV